MSDRISLKILQSFKQAKKLVYSATVDNYAVNYI